MALSFAAVKDDVCHAVFSVAYADLETHFKSTVDRLGADAESRLGQYAQWFAMDEPTAGDSPTEWTQWLVWHAAMSIAAVLKRDRYEGIKEQERAASEAAITLLSASNPKTGVPTPQDSNLLTVRQVYRHVLLFCVRRSPRVWPPVEAISSALSWAVNSLWYRREWTFRRVEATLTIDSAGAVTVSPVSVAAESFASAKLYATDGSGGVLKWATADVIAQSKANNPNERGRPRIFHFSTSPTNATIEWVIYPLPSAGQTYTFRGWLLKPAPAFPTNNNDTDDFGHWPGQFKPLIKELVLAKVLDDANAQDGRRRMGEVEEEIGRLAPLYVDRGTKIGAGIRMTDIYGDTREILQ